MIETVNHPEHYGGDTPYEAIKVIDAWGLGFALGRLCVRCVRELLRLRGQWPGFLKGAGGPAVDALAVDTRLAAMWRGEKRRRKAKEERCLL